VRREIDGACRRSTGGDPELLPLLREASTGKHGGDRKSEDFKSDNITLETPARGKKTTSNGPSLEPGNSRDYILARLKRDHPELAERVVDGDLSANAAAIEAGFRRKATPLDQLTRAWSKATEEERKGVQMAKKVAAVAPD
jgi:hypothetical protein